MAADLNGVLNKSLEENVKSSKVLVVGAGGIGCELLKTLLLTGFRDIEIIDLDTIDVSNLNRQFLFQKQHIGKSKAKVAKEIAQRMNKNAQIKAYHDSITSVEYGVPFFKQFTVVMNALDNRAARNHVNRMCLAADVPLIESGSAGYLGQVGAIKKGLTECYECVPKAPEKTYPGCTIRNTPSQLIHCIVWAKHLFNQLFGEADPDEDVSPDTADPNAGSLDMKSFENDASNEGNINRISTRSWAESTGYDPQKLFNKLFHDDIKYLLKMDKLWRTRRAPVPLDWNNLPDAVACSSKSISEFREQRIWSIQECASVFAKSVLKLTDEISKLKDNSHLIWDKDHDVAMDFVAACANVRAYIFGIAQNSRFEIKTMAGNIIPAIAMTNAVIAGLIVIEAMKIIDRRFNECKMFFLLKRPHPKKKYVLATNKIVPPNPKCIVCSSKPEIAVKLNLKTFSIKMLEERILKGQLNMIAPDVEIDDGKGTILISSEEGETSANNEKFLTQFNLRDGSRLKCDDFLQNYQLILNLVHCDRLDDDMEFQIIGGKPEIQEKSDENNDIRNGSQAKTSITHDEDDVMLINDPELIDGVVGKKRDREANLELNEPLAKKQKLSEIE